MYKPLYRMVDNNLNSCIKDAHAWFNTIYASQYPLQQILIASSVQHLLLMHFITYFIVRYLRK